MGPLSQRKVPTRPKREAKSKGSWAFQSAQANNDNAHMIDLPSEYNVK